MGQLHFDHVSVDRDDADVERGLGVAPLEEAGRLAQDQPDGREEGEEVAAEPEKKERERKLIIKKVKTIYFAVLASFRGNITRGKKEKFRRLLVEYGTLILRVSVMSSAVRLTQHLQLPSQSI